MRRHVRRWISPISFLAMCTLAACGPRTPRPDEGTASPAAATDSAADAEPIVAALDRLIAGADERPGATAAAGLKAFYTARHDRAVWHVRGVLSPLGREAARLLADAATEGLEPTDYLSASVTGLVGTTNGAEDRARLDVALTAGMLRFMRDLHLGRVDPRQLDAKLAPPEAHDIAAVLASAIDRQDLGEAIRALRPPLNQYDALRRSLADMRRRAASAEGAPIPRPAASVHPGEAYPAAAALAARLVALGDLAAVPAGDMALYGGELVAGVQRFQARHGLDSDGVLGARTVVALNVPLAWRVRQIELSLERLRWLPDFGDGRVIGINIPMFHLWAWDGSPATVPPVLDMDVIVGQALRTQTPVIDRQLRTVIFRPYWNVPRSILLSEILPKMRKDPSYLTTSDMEIVRGQTDGAEVVPFTPEAMTELSRGTLRVRQRPGLKNALGAVKFVFPNDDAIYMHGTPAPELFTRDRRDFSHGCVRVERPADLAAWVLRDRPEWTPTRIADAMAGRTPIDVSLPVAIRVVLFYTTAAVLSSDGALHFADDIYRLDPPLDAAVRTRQR